MGGHNASTKRDYGTNVNNGTNGKIPLEACGTAVFFRLFRYLQYHLSPSLIIGQIKLYQPNFIQKGFICDQITTLSV